MDYGYCSHIKKPGLLSHSFDNFLLVLCLFYYFFFFVFFLFQDERLVAASFTLTSIAFF